ncbi:RNA-mediated, partial [Pristimantis euphronides]
MDYLCDEDRDHLGCTVFQRTREDHKIAHSIEDETFLKVMGQGFCKNETNSWVAPLPFKPQRPCLPNNKEQALKRLAALKRNFQKRPKMKEHFFAFMEKIFKNGHAEIAPPLKEKEEERWYLPIFGVYHPKKLRQICVVFDSSSQYKGISLNDVLLTGPDLNNTLIGVLRFRKEPVAITADIQQMFHCFFVKEEHRDFLRFFWFRDNDPTKDIIEYHMKVHIFGNSPSPAVAIYGLRLSAREGEKDFGEDVKQFVQRDFYVDDGLKSLPSPEAAISLLKRTQSALACTNLRLHKIASNSKEVMKAFPMQDYADELKDLDLATDSLPVQRSLGLIWDLKSNTFTFQVNSAKTLHTTGSLVYDQQ